MRCRTANALSLALSLAFSLIGSLIGWALSPAQSFANGAFPDSVGLFVPADQSERILLATNFGLLVRDRADTRFDWICESAIAGGAFLYQLGAPANDRLYALGMMGELASTSSAACTFDQASLGAPMTQVLDFFPDPNDPLRVLAIFVVPSEPDTVRVSSDGGRTFGTPIFSAPPGAHIRSLESAKSDPQVLYLALSDANLHPVLERSMNGGQSFEEVALTALAGGNYLPPRIAAVDPENSMKIYLRVSDKNLGDNIAITTDAGDTVRVAVSSPGAFSAFLRRADGTLLVANKFDRGGFRSKNGGDTFEPWTTAVHMRALAERDGVLYAATDDEVDGYAIQTSRDEGEHWEPVLHFADVSGPRDCPSVHAMCDAEWQFTGKRIGAIVVPDAGTGMPPPKSGCSCASSKAGSHAAPFMLIFAALIALYAVRRPRRSRR